ncbi:hypothetical protein AMTR_s00151p00059530 [Amborella trichopoda]|uniref:Uncharacterized protein n=1 Tax=Amborella trichopoda TaxID=13333 RepID=W1NJZ3_AMBTC|nr:hypothetical protein AMTR_s00151p00059530 [Amborella trichopoda]
MCLSSLVIGPSDNIFIDAFGLVLNKAVTETKEGMYLVSVGVASFRSGGALHDHEALGVSREVWVDLDKRMDWDTRLLLLGWSRFVVPHYCRVGDMTADYLQWWDFSNTEYWGMAHPWQAASCSRRHGMAGRSFVPPPLSVTFILDHYHANWQELTKPCLISADEDGMKLLSLERRTEYYFDNLEVIFGLKERGVDPSCEEGPALALPARLEGEPRSCSSRWANSAPRDSASIKPKSTPPKEKEDRERERKRKRGRESSPVPSSRERGSRSNKKDLPSARVSSVPSHAKRARSGVCKASKSPRAASVSTPAVVLRSADYWPEWSSSPMLGSGRV